MLCPDDTTALQFVQGKLAPSEKRAVQSHLDGCPRCFSSITELARVFGSEIAQTSETAFADTVQHASEGSGIRHRDAELAPRAQRAELLPGARIGRYEVRWRIGAGGMGAVYAAYDELLARLVALKVLDPEAVGGFDVERFVLQEARAASALAHPNLVVVFDVGAVPLPGREDKRLVYIAMELVEGASFGQWLAAAPRSQAEIVGALLQAGEGLAAMHERGLIHRDVKPDNLLVGHDGRVRVTDFGLVAPAHEAASGGLLVGTPAYMSPEQLFSRATDPRSDQFSFAVVVHEALTGARPFSGRSLDELRWAVTRGARAPVPGLPRALREVLDTALAIDPTWRHPSLRVFLQRLAIAARPAENIHVRVNTWLSAGMTAVHAIMTAVMVRAVAAPSPPSPPGVSSASEGPSGPGDVLMYALAAVFLFGALISLVWLPVGVVWAPLNAWGLAKRRAWARRSALVYAGLGLFTCFGTPYAAYALFSLTRPRIKQLFEQGDP